MVGGRRFRAIVVGTRPTVTVPVQDSAAPNLYKVPDLVAVSDLSSLGDCALIVEVESDPRRFLEALGKCVLWRVVARFVYLAYPGGIRPTPKILEKYGIGLLDVSEDCVREQIRVLPEDERSPWVVNEVHPLEYARQMELVNQVRRLLDAST